MAIRSLPLRSTARAAQAISSSVLCGCSRAPSIEVLGAFFPDWMFSIAGAIVLAALARLIAVKAGGGGDFGLASLLSFLALTTIFAVLGWLFFFGG